MLLSRSNLGMASLRTFRVERLGIIQCGTAYYEVEILTNGHIRVGWCTPSMSIATSVRVVLNLNPLNYASCCMICTKKIFVDCITFYSLAGS